MTGIALRLLLVAAWLALTGWHLAERVLPAWGLAPASDAGAVLAERVGRTLHYAVLWQPPGQEPLRVGQAVASAIADDIGLRLEVALDLADTRFIPAERLLRRSLGGRARAGIRLRATSQLDATLSLRRIELEGSLFGLPARAAGPVTHEGLRLAWEAAGQQGELLIPEVRPERQAGSELALALPRGLRPGQRFTQRLTALDPVRLRPATAEALFTVRQRARLPTAAGELELNEVEMSLGGRRIATLWADAQGTVHRQELADLGLVLDLQRVIDLSTGTTLWPPSPTTP